MCPEREEFVEARQRTLRSVDRRGGDSPLSVSSLGDQRTFWASTGSVTAGSIKRIYLTSTGTARSPSIFERTPAVVVYAGTGTDVLVRADGVPDPAKALILENVTTWHLLWLGSAAPTWAVDVTNESSAARDYLVRAEGV